MTQEGGRRSSLNLAVNATAAPSSLPTNNTTCTKGYLRKRDEAAIQQEVSNLLEKSPQSIPRESRYLLEIQYQPTTSPTLEHSSYWVLALRAAKQAVHSEQSRCTTQGAGARHQESRRGVQGRYWNIMEGVRESLRRRTQQEEQSRK